MGSQIGDAIRGIASHLDNAGMRYEGSQLAQFMAGLFDDEYVKVRKTEPRSPEQLEVAQRRREEIVDWLLHNQPPSFNGDRQTCMSRGEILDKMGRPQTRENDSTLRAVLNNRFLTDWSVVTEIAGQQLYAHVPKLLPFRVLLQAAA